MGISAVSAVACALAALLGAAQLIAQVPQTRTISLRNIHTDDVVTVEYKRNGRYVPDAMAKINWVMRDWRRDESTKMDPALIDLLWEMHHELGSKVPINIISAYRSRATNNMLRASRGGQASESRHILGKAADVQFPDVPVRQLRYAAMVRERGGVGYYPTSATPFIHVDTDHVRAWPRMPRFELALLFPNGRTQHKPADGGDLTMEDVRTARARQPEVAVHLAAFHDMRRRAREPNLMTALAPGADIDFGAPKAASPIALPKAPQAPQLVASPRLADRPSRLALRPSEDDRLRMMQLSAFAGVRETTTEPLLVQGPVPATRQSAAGAVTAKRKVHEPEGETAAASSGGLYPRLVFLTAEGADTLKGWSTGFSPAPAWDEDHPEEASYRPFPLAPFLTETASVDDPALTKLLHPDLTRTAELFDTSQAVEPMRLRPGRNLSELMWSETWGNTIALDQLGPQPAPGQVAARRVATEAKVAR